MGARSSERCELSQDVLSLTLHNRFMSLSVVHGVHNVDFSFASSR